MFGLRAAGDPNLMRQLRHGFSLPPAPADQILAHVDAYERAHLDPVSSQSSRLRDSLSGERSGRGMTTMTVEEVDAPIRLVPDKGRASPPGIAPEHHLSASRRRDYREADALWAAG